MGAFHSLCFYALFNAFIPIKMVNTKIPKARMLAKSPLTLMQLSFLQKLTSLLLFILLIFIKQFFFLFSTERTCRDNRIVLVDFSYLYFDQLIALPTLFGMSK